MRTFSLLKGLPVYELKSGSKIGVVCDLNISSNGLVKGLLVKKGVLIKKTFCIDVQKVTSFGYDGVMVEDGYVLEPITEHAEYTFENHDRLLGRMMISKRGRTSRFFRGCIFYGRSGYDNWV